MKKLSLIELLLLIAACAFILRACFGGFAQVARAQSIERCTIDYDPGLGIPRQVAWSILPGDLGEVKRDPSFRFKADKAQPRPRVTSGLYAHSGYQRGHMCPAADRSASRRSMRSTFLMSNVCPMAPALNMGAWKSLEAQARKEAVTLGKCSVIAAPIFFPVDTAWIGRGRVAVPHAFFKRIWDAQSDSLIWSKFFYNY